MNLPLSEPGPETLAAAAEIFAGLDREVWVVTAAAGRQRGGLVATWVAPASIDPTEPWLLAALAKNHFTAELVNAGGRFVAHLLRPEQAALALGFACGSGRERDKLAGLELVVTVGGVPRLADCQAWVEARVVDHHDAGDRWFYWGQVEAAGKTGSGPNLMASGLFAAATPEQVAQLAAGLACDLDVHRPLRAEWLARVAGGSAGTA